MTEIGSSRAEARQLGLKFYQGKLCPLRHTSYRYVSNGACVKCVKSDCRNSPRASQWMKDNPEARKEYSRRYYKKNPKKFVADNAKRRATLLQATLSGYDAEIKTIYLNCPKGWHVDHDIPLKGMNVCGLHVPWNLQYLTADANLRKGNRLK